MKPDFPEIMRRMLEIGRFRNYSEMARKLGVSPQAISNYKRRGEVSPNIILKFAKTFGVSVDWLLTGEGEIYRKRETLYSRPCGFGAGFTGAERSKISFAGEGQAFLELEEVVYIGKLLNIMRSPHKEAVRAVKLSIDAFYRDLFPS